MSKNAQQAAAGTVAKDAKKEAEKKKKWNFIIILQ